MCLRFCGLVTWLIVSERTCSICFGSAGPKKNIVKMILEPVLKDSKYQHGFDIHLQPDLGGPESEEASEVSGGGEFTSIAAEVDEIFPTC